MRDPYPPTGYGLPRRLEIDASSVRLAVSSVSSLLMVLNMDGEQIDLR